MSSSRALVASSRNARAGFATNRRANETRCCSPSESTFAQSSWRERFPFVLSINAVRFNCSRIARSSSSRSLCSRAGYSKIALSDPTGMYGRWGRNIISRRRGRMIEPCPLFQSPATVRSKELFPVPLGPMIRSPSPRGTFNDRSAISVSLLFGGQMDSSVRTSVFPSSTSICGSSSCSSRTRAFNTSQRSERRVTPAE